MKEQEHSAGATGRLALGFRAHSGWAAMVAVAMEGRQPVAVDRRRLVLADPSIPGSKQPYHRAEGWPLARAKEYLDRCHRSTATLARTAVAAAGKELRRCGYELVACAVLGASGRPVITLEAALASHAMLHTAEGELFRNALLEAGAALGLPAVKIEERELFAEAAATLRLPEARLRAVTAEMGRALGPPWTQDEKLAALLAWTVLASGERKRRAQSA